MLYKLSFLYTHTYTFHLQLPLSGAGVGGWCLWREEQQGCDPSPGFIFPDGTPVSLPAHLCSFSVDAQGSKEQGRAPHREAGSKETAQGSRGWGAVTCQLETPQCWCVFQSVSKGCWHEPRTEGGREWEIPAQHWEERGDILPASGFSSQIFSWQDGAPHWGGWPLSPLIRCWAHPETPHTGPERMFQLVKLTHKLTATCSPTRPPG